MGLVPSDPRRGDRAEVQPLDERRLEERPAKGRVLSDGRDHQRGTDLPKHGGLGGLDQARVRKKKFAIGQRMGEGAAPHEGRAQINRAVQSDFSRPVPVRGSDVRCAGDAKTFFDDGIDALGN